MSENLKKYLMEFIGTYFLVLAIGCLGNLAGDKTLAPLVIGGTLMILVYAGGKISGGHYNPAVSLSVYLNRGIGTKDFFGYLTAQILGCIGSAWTVVYLADGGNMPALGFYMPALILGEFLFTFLLCLTVLLTTRKEVQPNCYWGLAIGSVLTVGVASVGTVICLGAFNPAVALALALMNNCCMKLSLVTILTNLVGGTAAYGVFKLLSTDEP